jgi:hypothetical protein
MTTINIQESSNPTKYLVITQQKDPETLITTRVLITDNANNRIDVIEIGRGPIGPQGPTGLQGPPGQDAISFDVLSVSSGGTNNTSFTSNKIIYYDGTRLSSTNYSVDDLLNNVNAITGIIEGSGIYKTTNGSNVTIGAKLGDGLTTDGSNHIIVDDTIARKYELSLGTISGILPINKGGTNNSLFNTNRLVYYDGNQLTSFPLETGRIVTSGSTISVIAGSGLVGGGSLSIPNGSIVINIGNSQDIIVSDSAIELSTTGNPGWYTKILTDSKGRVVSGLSLSSGDVTNALGYIPWYPGNDGSGSLLDADLLDGRDGSYYLNFANLTGSIQTNILPDIIVPGTFTKVTTNSKGLVINGTGLNFSDVITALDYIPFSTSGGTIYGNVETIGNLYVRNGNVTFEDNLPLFSYDNNSMLPTDPRGFSFEYGSIIKKTGLLAYFPADQQLKLIVDIVSSGDNDIDGGDGENNFNGDIDGGDASSIYVLGNIVGEEAIVLLEHIADQKYLNLTQSQSISGVKTFYDGINVYNSLSILQGVAYGGPPFFIGSNTGLVTSLNSDLLDNNHGSFYRNAINLTGTLDYNNTTVTNLAGTPNYVPKFNGLTNNPSRTIDDSIMQQSGQTMLIANGSLSVGTNLNQQSKTVSIGSNNTTSGNFGLSVGSGAYTWLNNQISIGAFVELSGLTQLGRAQTSTTAIGYYGDTGGIYQTLKPIIQVPNNKTVLYNIDLLFSKFGSSGLASISFHSGLIKNINNNCYIINSGNKSELYNNSQIREYIYTADNDTHNLSENQLLSVTPSPIKHTSGNIQNLQSLYKIRIDPSLQNGTFNKFFNGDIFLYINEPVTSGKYSTSSNSKNILVTSYDHGCVTGCMMSFIPISGSNILPITGMYEVTSIPDNHSFTINDRSWSGHYNNGSINIHNNNINFIDSLGNISFSGTFDNSSTTISNCSPSPSGRVFPGMNLAVSSGFSSSPVITGVTSSSILINIPYSGSSTDLLFATSGYSVFKLSQCNQIYFEGGEYAQVVARTGSVVTTSSGIRIYTSGFTGSSTVSPVNVYSLFNSSGLMYITEKRNYDATYQRSTASFNTYYVNYIQYQSSSNTGQIVFSANQPVSGYAPNYNPYFKFLSATNSFSGILTNGSNVITSCVPSQSGRLFEGMILYSNVSGFPTTGNRIAVSPTGNSIQLDVLFSGVTANNLITYSGYIADTNYEILNTTPSGLSVKTVYTPPESGAFLSGVAIMYNGTGVSDISITTTTLCNLQFGITGYLRFTSNNTGLKPVDDNYKITSTSLGSFSIKNYHLMPDSGISATGFAKLNLNKDHGYLPPNSVTNLIQDIPLSFNMKNSYYVVGGSGVSAYTSNNELTYRKPESGLYEIKAVTGYSVVISDYPRTLVAENGKQISFDTYASGSYEVQSSDNNQISVKYYHKYFNLHDSIYLSFTNNEHCNQTFRITGVRDFGSYGYYDLRTASGTLTGTPLIPNTGFVKYIGTCSGTIDRFYNLIYFNYAGDTFEYWKRDSAGKYVNPPRTGYFVVYDSPSLCYSGNLCIHISGISDITNIQPNQSFYFDFIDGNSSLDNYYSVNDKIKPEVLSLSIPYNTNFLNNSGLVLIIDSTENIKTNRNPNENNTFIKTTQSVSPASSFLGTLNKFNSYNNKWKYGSILKQNLLPQRIETTLVINGDNNSKTKTTDIIVLSENPLSASIEYSFDKTTFYNAESSIFDAYVNQPLYLKIIVSGGAGKWSNDIDTSCPRINILGLDYNIFTQDRNYNSSTQSWEIVVTCSSNTKIVSNKSVEIIISDISERIFKTISLNRKQKLTATSIQNVKYGYANDTQNWFMLLEAYGGNLSPSNQPLVQVISGFPNNAGVQVSIDYLNYPSGWWGISLQGLPSATAQTFNPVISIRELTDPTETIYVTGTLYVTQQDQIYDLTFRTLSSDANIPYLNNNVDDFGFLVPVFTNDNANFTVNFNNTDSLSFGTPSIEYRPNLKAFAYRVNISGAAGFYEPSFIVNVNQPSGITSDVLFTKATGINVSIYNPIYLNLAEYIQPIVFEEDNLWVFTFYVQDGGVAFRENIQPSVFIGKTPNIGTYNQFPLEYNIGKQYDPVNSRWIVSVTGLPDQFGNFVTSTGIYDLGIYIEDYTTSNSNTIQLRIDPIRSIFMQDYAYATPNNGFEFAVDVDSPKASSPLTLSFPAQLKDSLIIPSLKYSKYDEDLSIWEYYYSGQPITEKWDARLQLSDNSLSIQAKGILNDKIYVAGKVETIETENAFSVFTPLQIVGLNQEYVFDEGTKWSLEFGTIGGLENPLYPPRITMNGFPPASPCSGYNPSAGEQPICFKERTWSNSLKKWIFKFEGVPLCISNVQFNINITATDTINEEIFGSDSATTIFRYDPIADHPAPSAPDTFDQSLFPLCLHYSDSNTYKINIRQICPAPTGITGLITWGSLPPGLTMTDSRNGQYQSPWSDLTGGTVTIQGNPTTFASGGDYAESFNIAVIDARGKSGVLQNIKFRDSSSPILPSPTEMTIYFSGIDYAYSPSLSVGQQIILGGEHVQNINQDMARPPASNISMQCLSRLPHNQCLYSTGLYTIYDDNNIKLSGYGTSSSIPSIKRINNGEKIYLEFDNQINSSFNKEYICLRPDNHSILITVSGHGISPSISGQVGILKTQGNIQSLLISQAGYLGNPPTTPTTSTTTGIMGDGKYTVRNSLRGFQGRFKPAFSGSPLSGIYKSSFTHHSDMAISGIPGADPNVYNIEFVNCYETGYLRVSGVILPSPILEITDPPPAETQFAFDSQSYAFSARIAYGDVITRNSGVNQRSGKNISTYIYSAQPQITGYNTVLGNATTNTQPGGTSFATINYSSPVLTSGLVFGMNIRHDSTDIFPTYNKYAMPSLINQYFWVQRAGSKNAVITENTFPPHVPVYSGDLMFVSGTPVNFNIDMVGGFIPTGQWTFSNYLNSTSGFIQLPIGNTIITGIYSKEFSSNILSINVPNNPLNTGDFVKINAYTSNISLPTPFIATGVQLVNISGNNIYISGLPSNVTMGGRVDIAYAGKVSSGVVPFQVRIDYGSGQSGFYKKNQSIDIISLNNDLISTQNHLMPKNLRLSIISGTSTYSYAGIDAIVLSGTFTNNSPTITNCTVNPEFILKSGYNIYANIAGLPNPATVSSVTNNSITLTSNFTGTTSNNIEIIHSGDNITGYYTALLSGMSGICEVREQLYNSGNRFDLSFGSTLYDNNPGYTYSSITGSVDNLRGKYLYKVITAENTGLPSIVNSGWSNKKFSKSYNMIATQPLSIVGDPSIFSNINIDNNVWTLQFHVTGGFIPKKDSNLVVEIDGYIHTFTTGVNYISESGAQINITANSAINWSGYFVNNSPSELKVFDKLSFDTRSLTADFGA